MINFNRIPKDLPWFAKRYNALLVEFPKEITPLVLKKDDLCSGHDPEEVYDALKSAHGFLTSIASELLSMPEQDEEGKKHIEKVIYKLETLWGLIFSSELNEEGNEYSITFKKPLMSGLKTLPPNYSKSMQHLQENGCWIEYLKDGKEAKDFKSCDNGILHFDDRLTALGIYLFIKKCAQKRWYGKEDKAGGYTKKLQYTPILHCVEPYYRTDLRVFTCGERLIFDTIEELAGYNDDFKRYFRKIYDFVAKNYPDCIPENGIFGFIHCSVTFGVDAEHRMIGQIGIGSTKTVLVFMLP